MEAVNKDRSNPAQALQTLGYLIPAVGIGSIIFWALLEVFNGLEPHPLMFVGVLGCVGLLVAGILALFRPRQARILAACSLIVFTPVFIEWVIALVPLPNTTLGLENYLVPLLYLFALATVLFLPRKIRFGLTILVLACIAAAAIASTTYVQRVNSGTYDPPNMACFRWLAEPSDQLIVNDEIGTISRDVREMLFAAGIRGTLNWKHASTTSTTRNRMIILLKDRPRTDDKLFAPNNCLIVYAFDGKSWQKIPAGAPTYRSYVRVENDQVGPIFYDEAGGIVSSMQWDH